MELHFFFSVAFPFQYPAREQEKLCHFIIPFLFVYKNTREIHIRKQARFSFNVIIGHAVCDNCPLKIESSSI